MDLALRSGWFSETSRALASIKTGTVTNSNADTHLYDVWADDNTKYPGIALMSPYINISKGQGYTAVAAVGSRCVLGVAENKEAFIMGFIVPAGLKPSPVDASSNFGGGRSGGGGAGRNFSEELSAETVQLRSNSYIGRAGNRPERAQIDDQELRGPKGNYLNVRSSGAIEIVSNDGLLLTRWISNPGDNVIISLADALESLFPGGSYKWKTNYQDNSTNVVLQLKSQLDLTDPNIQIKLGKLPEEDADKDNLITVSAVPVGSSKVVKVSINTSGEVKIEAEKLTIETTGETNVNCNNANIKAKSRVKISGRKIELV